MMPTVTPITTPRAASSAVLLALALAIVIGLFTVTARDARALTPTPVPQERCAADAFFGLRSKGRGICEELAAAPRLSSAKPRAQAALALWGKLAEPVEALTERSTGIVLLAEDARQRDGRPFAPAAWICPGAPPVIFVPHTLLEAAYDPASGLGEDFLGFVLAHELGHRVNDFTVDGCPAAFTGDAAPSPLEHERRADFRGAFFAAVAGIDTRALSRRGIISRFLETEFRVRSSDLKARQTALDEALGWFDALEDVYQAGLALTLAGERGVAVRFLARLDEQLAARAIPLPEVTFAHALALVSDAASDAPWLDALERLPAPAEALACHAVHPDHGAFSDDFYQGRVRADPARREAARRALVKARRLVERAGDLGAAPLAVASARACIALLSGDADLAVSLAEAAKNRAGRASKSVQETLAANLALARFSRWLVASPPPAEGHADLRPWLDRLAALRPELVPHAALDRYVARLVGLPSTPLLAGAPKCAGGPAPLAAPPIADRSLDAPPGACPAGWERFDADRNSLDRAAALGDGSRRPPGRAAALGAEGDVLVCRRANRALVRASLPALSDPPLPAVDTAVLLYGAPPPSLRSLEAWSCGCDHLSLRGVSDVGETAWLATCPRLGMPLNLLLSDPRGRVRRLALIP